MLVTAAVSLPLAHTSWYGVLPQWLILTGIVMAAVIFWRGGGSTAIASLEAVNRVLVRDNEKMKGQLEAAAQRLAVLETRTDFAAQLKPIREWQLTHEAHAQDRFDQQLAVLQMIAQRLGPEPPNGA